MSDNAEQIAEWNGVIGQRWAELQTDLDALVGPFGEAALQRAAPQPGERVTDVGCGCGDTTLALARRVGASGRVVGVDVSRAMLDVARSRVAQQGLANLSFVEGDAAETELPQRSDLVFSRFGTMFFSQPAAAFGHLRSSLRAGGRCVFVCWRTPRDNAWAMTPLIAARKALGITPAAADPNAPGPFAFADQDRLRAILAEAGFQRIDVQRFDAAILLGATPRAAAENALKVGPTSRLVRDAGNEHVPAILAAVEAALAALAAPDGRVSLDGSTWVVSAVN